MRSGKRLNLCARFNSKKNQLPRCFAEIVSILCLIQVIAGRLHGAVQPSSRPVDLFKEIYICPAADNDILQLKDMCHQLKSNTEHSPPTFLFYDVNAMEGFNLRRDVYIRMAAFIRAFRKMVGYENVVLVLPPFHQLYHWQLVQTPDESRQENIVSWTHFFDLPSMRRFTEVIDLWQYFSLMRDCFGHRAGKSYSLDHVFKLKHFESMFTSGKFEERFETFGVCNEADKRSARQQFIGLYTNFSISKFHCIEFQGSAMLLANLLKQYPKTYVYCEHSSGKIFIKLMTFDFQEFATDTSYCNFKC